MEIKENIHKTEPLGFLAVFSTTDGSIIPQENVENQSDERNIICLIGYIHVKVKPFLKS